MTLRDSITPYQFEDDGKIPNNPALPLLVYSGVLSADGDLTDHCKALFQRNGWGGVWVNGVFSYHHYHSTAHEVLGVTAGTATLQFGGENGDTLDVSAGDVVVIPAGVGHCNKGASGDFRVVGAYPKGQDWDLRKGSPGERPRVLENIKRVPLPRTDPVSGEQSPLLDLWQTD